MTHGSDRPGGGDPGYPNRRDVLRAGSAMALGLGPTPKASPAADGDVGCILLLLVGGPSHLDTWDLKPDSPSGIKGPFRPIETAVPGLRISEIFPRMAGVMDRVALVRGVVLGPLPVHDVGHQLIQAGRPSSPGVEHPHFGSVLGRLTGLPDDRPAHVVLNGPIGNTGGNMAHGQGAGYLGGPFEPLVVDAERAPGLHPRLRDALSVADESASLRDRYGRTRFGRDCLRARRLVESGVRFVTVNMYRTVFGEPTWDCHGAAPFAPLDAYRTTVGPTFDAAYATLLEDLDRRGRLGSTLVLALGEFGRTPTINRAGGRDHHVGCSTALFAGGPVRGGRVVGASDPTGFAPRDRAVTPAEIAATVYEALGLSLDAELDGPDGCPIRLVDHGVEPIPGLS